MLFLKETNPSLVKRTLFTVTISMSLLICFFISYQAYVEYIALNSFEDRIIEEQVELILQSHEVYRLSGDHKNIATKLWRLDLVKAVALFKGDCVLIARQPLNTITNNICKKNTEWRHITISDSFSDLNDIYILKKSMLAPQLKDKILRIIFFGTLLMILSYTLSKWLINLIIKRPIEDVVDVILNNRLETNNYDQSNIIDRTPIE